MKKTLGLFLMLFSVLNYAQNNSTLKNQKIALKEAERFLNRNDLEMAADILKYTIALDPKSKIGELAGSKYDLIIKNKVLKDILGKWVLFERGSNWGFTEEKDNLKRKVLIITETEFQFYEENIQSKELKTIKTEKIILTKQEDGSRSSFDFVFSDKSLWSFFFDEKFGFLRQFNTGEETNEGRTEIFCGNSELRYKRYN
ncbi:hypothetical protein K6T82_02860 [Flavobacterium sp. 17A]|uniref:Uncharacterized protein n=1 Tax=Flavobacterium potami TaxID=2872310 RepID=A0A9X1H6E8_9FLAO|nr:hypothetical protein [Flavobacterium potami]MBZ4033689.1 hypothetical protein [Flavobacterium potami]